MPCDWQTLSLLIHMETAGRAMQLAVWILGPGLGYTFDALSIQTTLLLYINCV